ncbi:hypothetical protein K469DRAFT_653905 [Zopfia rhizophila CBS 207.26]|uniref:Uncharacterized protein n=1 Tax=Zopfia rhizophila CBS 207.26 TaxID=1314779 RepID=A0A6A6ENT1_9PEZI|nr:hypothetical protein K469DRAFT_653905 [Zopfia rhizophila CBS 207.26]
MDAQGKGLRRIGESLEQRRRERTEKAIEQENVGRNMNFRKRFLTKNYECNVETTQGFTLQGNSLPIQNFTRIFLAHAQLYCVADTYLTLTLLKLHKTLKNFMLYPTRVGDTINIVRFAYSSIPDRNDDEKVDILRELLVEYMVLEATRVGSTEEFEELPKEDDGFVVDFWRAVSVES